MVAIPAGCCGRFQAGREKTSAAAGEVASQAAVAAVTEALCDPQMAGEHLAEVLGQRGKVLLLIDDVWTEDQVQPFLVGAKRCMRLVTTRNSALPLNSATRVHVGRMSDHQACDLLLRGIPLDVTHCLGTALLDRVISRTWHWPLILDVLNKNG